MRHLAAFITVILSVSGAACAHSPPPMAAVGTTETTAASFSPQPAQFRRPSSNAASVAFVVPAGAVGPEDIAAVVRAIVDTQLSESRFAAARARSQTVRDIAAHAARDFGKADETLNALATLQPFDVEDTATSKSLRAASASSLAALRSATDSDFDRVYVSATIETRTRLVDALDQMASQADPDVRRGLIELRATLADCLHDAREANARLEREL